MKKTIFVLILLHTQVKGQDSLIYPVYFEYRVAQLDSMEMKTLNFFIRQFKNYEITNILVNGYCDDRGTNISNNQLSLQRAQHIDSLLSGMLDSSIKISAYGRGELTLSDDENIDQQRDRNRRGEIKVYYKKASEKQLAKNAKNNPKKNVNLKEFLATSSTGERLDLCINFIPGRHFPIKTSIPKLDTLYHLLASNFRKILIEGHILSDGMQGDGMDEDTRERKLSENRAKFIYEFLIQRGIAANRLRYIGMKGRVPSPRGHSFDRRVEIVLEE